MRGYFDASGALRTDVAAPERIGARGRPLAPRHVVEYALIWAAGHGRPDVVEFLLTKDPDLRVTEPIFGATALGFARHKENAAVVALLEPP